jgi:general secretion pathway protein A
MNMYLDYFNLRQEPFSTTPDPRFLFKSAMHQEALDRLVTAVSLRRGINAIIGEPGLGKSLLIRTTLQGFSDRVRFAWIFNTSMNSRELVKYICRDFGFTPKGDDLGDLLMELYTYLIKAHEEGFYSILIIDEAQNLKIEVLEEIRQLSNLETSRSKLLQVILSGQTQLDAHLDDPALHQLKQRISLKAVLGRLDAESCKAYIAHRLAVAGSHSQKLFSEAALNSIFEISGGIPRLINQVCDNALLSGWQNKVKTIDAVLVRELVETNKVTPASPLRQTVVSPQTCATASPRQEPVPVVRPAVEPIKQEKQEQLLFAGTSTFDGVDVDRL